MKSNLFGTIVRHITWLDQTFISSLNIWKKFLRDKPKSLELQWDSNKFSQLHQLVKLNIVKSNSSIEKVKDGKKKKENTGGIDDKSDGEEEEDNNQYYLRHNILILL
jgi:hypothetical protein